MAVADCGHLPVVELGMPLQLAFSNADLKHKHWIDLQNKTNKTKVALYLNFPP